MDAECGVTCHLQCEISSVSVTGLARSGSRHNGELFLRCHVPAGGGRAIQIDSRSATANGGVVSWRDVASLSCDGAPAFVRELVERRSMVFEVRRRRAVALQRRLLGSELVGRAEVAWRDAADEAVQVVLAAPGSGGRAMQRGDVATPTVMMSVRMSVRVSETATVAGGGRRRVASDSAAREESGWSVGDEAVFGLAACAAEGALE